MFYAYVCSLMCRWYVFMREYGSVCVLGVRVCVCYYPVRVYVYLASCAGHM
jgi:hypothetical protein